MECQSPVGHAPGMRFRNFLTISASGRVLSFIAVCGHSSQSAIAYDAQTQNPASLRGLVRFDGGMGALAY